MTVLSDTKSGFEGLYWVLMESQWLIFRVLGEPLIGNVACYWLGPSRIGMKGINDGIIGKKNVVIFVLVTCVLHVGMMLELWPPQNLLLANYWLHAGLARIYPVPGCGPWVPTSIVLVLCRPTLATHWPALACQTHYLRTKSCLADAFCEGQTMHD